jgi:hypothetical protein
MGERSKIEGLPPEIKGELDRRLVEGGFKDYVALQDWLRSRGCEVGKSSVHRYGTKLEERLYKLRQATDQAKALVSGSPDDAGDMNEAILRLMQEKMFDALLRMDDVEGESLGGLAKALAPLVRANIANKKFATEVKAKAQEAADAVEKLARKGGLSADTVKDIRRQILGVAG